jgi:hypothetical protein
MSKTVAESKWQGKPKSFNYGADVVDFLHKQAAKNEKYYFERFPRASPKPWSLAQRSLRTRNASCQHSITSCWLRFIHPARHKSKNANGFTAK